MTNSFDSNEDSLDYVDTTMYTRTFSIGKKTQLHYLKECAAGYWGFADSLTKIYFVEEDGTVRDLKNEMD